MLSNSLKEKAYHKIRRDIISNLFAAGMAALNHDVEMLSEFEQRFIEYVGRTPSDYEGMRECGKRFHQFIVECTRNPRLKESVFNLNGQMDRIRTIFCPLLPHAYIKDALFDLISIPKREFLSILIN